MFAGNQRERFILVLIVVLPFLVVEHNTNGLKLMFKILNHFINRRCMNLS